MTRTTTKVSTRVKVAVAIALIIVLGVAYGLFLTYYSRTVSGPAGIAPAAPSTGAGAVNTTPNSASPTQP